MNKDAEAFFDAHPHENYWYYSPGLRVPRNNRQPQEPWHWLQWASRLTCRAL